MEPGKGHQEDEEEEEEEFGPKKDTISSDSNTKDVKNSGKGNAMRSKHSVTEQRRRSKINERYQILRELIPHSDQKRDTASFLLEVIQYVQLLQEKVQKYEGSCQTWNSEPAKLMPWRNSHWRVQSFVEQPQSTKNGSGHAAAFPVRFDENNISVSVAMQGSCQRNPVESDHIGDASCQSIDPQTEFPSKGMGIPMPLQAGISVPNTNDGAFSIPRSASDAQSTEYRMAAHSLNCPDELSIEGGTISISSVYSQGLLNSLTQALQSTGVDLSQASISIQINLGRQANRGLNPEISLAKDHDILMPSGNQPAGPFQDPNNSEDSNQSQKRLKI